MSADFYYPRQGLAATFADNLLGGGIVNYSSGLFLAAPRRTGKSSFLRRDLTPILRERGVAVIYVDLWEDRSRDPSDLLRAGLIAAQQDLAGWVRKATRGLRPKKVSIPGLGDIDFKDPEAVDKATLTELLAKLGDTARSDIALIVDEAQHVRVSPSGKETMFALKAARDAFAQQTVAAENARLILLFTGSDRRKLSELVTSRKAPFYGARIEEFPRLDDGYCRAYVEWLNQRLAEDQQFTAEQLVPIFERLGRRPEMLDDVIQQAVFGAGADQLEQVAQDYFNRLEDSMVEEYHSLDPLERQLVLRIADTEANFRPFTQGTVDMLRHVLDADITTSKIQTAMKNLSDQGLIWSPARGIYEIEDGEFARWLETQDLSEGDE